MFCFTTQRDQNITFDKNFMRNLGEQSVVVKKGIKYILSENDQFKRIKVYNNNNTWIDTKPLTIKFNKNRKENRQFLVRPNITSNLNELGSTITINKFLEGFKIYIKNILNKFDGNTYNIRNNIDVMFEVSRGYR